MAEPQVTLLPASEVDYHALLSAINSAYRDYFIPIQLTPDSFSELVRRESVLLEASQAAISGGRVVGMGLLGVRGRRGWIGGMGVIPSFRRRGIARLIMQALLSRACQLGLETLQLEVITRNQAAFSLYKSVGFHTRRRLSVLSGRMADLKGAPDMAAHDVTISSEPPADLLDALLEIPAPEPPWQRESAAHRAMLPQLKGLAARQGWRGRIVGICLYRDNGYYKDVAELAAMTPKTGAGLAAHLLRKHPSASFSYLNVPEEDPLLPILLGIGFQEVLAQFEMVLQLGVPPEVFQEHPW